MPDLATDPKGRDSKDGDPNISKNKSEGEHVQMPEESELGAVRRSCFQKCCWMCIVPTLSYRQPFVGARASLLSALTCCTRASVCAVSLTSPDSILNPPSQARGAVSFTSTDFIFKPPLWLRTPFQIDIPQHLLLHYPDGATWADDGACPLTCWVAISVVIGALMSLCGSVHTQHSMRGCSGGAET